MAKNDTPAIREATGAFCRSILDAILPAVREAARFQGYAVAVHGSLKRDIDLIAIAWTDQAKPADEALRAIKGAIGGVLGNCLEIGKGSTKPHGRIAFTLVHPGFAGEIDLSIIGPQPTRNAVLDEVASALDCSCGEYTPCDNSGNCRGFFAGQVRKMKLANG